MSMKGDNVHTVPGRKCSIGEMIDNDDDHITASHRPGNVCILAHLTSASR